LGQIQFYYSNQYIIIDFLFRIQSIKSMTDFNMSLVVREGCLTDEWNAWKQQITAGFGYAYNNNSDTIEPGNHLVEVNDFLALLQYKPNKCSCIIVTKDNDLAGFGIYGAHSEPFRCRKNKNPETYQIYAYCVNPKYRRQNVGTLLVSKIISLCPENIVWVAELGYIEHADGRCENNPISLRILKKAGFKVVSDQPGNAWLKRESFRI